MKIVEISPLVARAITFLMLHTKNHEEPSQKSLHTKFKILTLRNQSMRAHKLFELAEQVALSDIHQTEMVISWQTETGGGSPSPNQSIDSQRLFISI